MWGDGFQNGGVFIVDKGGQRVLFSFKQNQPSDKVENQVILDILDSTKSL